MRNSLNYYKSDSRAMLLALIVFLLFITTNQVQAAEIVVNSADDVLNGSSSRCILRDAIDAANTDQPSGSCPAGSGLDTIRFDLGQSSQPRTIQLISQLPKIYRDLVIRGPGASNLIIDGGGFNRVFHITAVSVVISGLSLQNGGGHGAQTDTHGGAIAIFGGNVELHKMSFERNVSSSGGGAIYLHSGLGFTGVLRIDNCNFVDNQARTNGWLNSGGGAIMAIGIDFSLMATNSSFVNNITVVDNTLHMNVLAPLGTHGGAILVIPMSDESESIVDISTCTFSGNKADGNGGAIAFMSPQGQNNQVKTLITSVTVVKNIADSDNNAQGRGGGIFAQAAKTEIKNSIVARNQQLGTIGGLHNPDVLGIYGSAGYNLIGDAGNSVGFTGTADQVGTSASPIAPGLFALTDNGGFGMTHLPRLNSNALDKGKCPTSSSDQRGIRRPVDLPVANATGGNGCDIGAVEMTEEEFKKLN